MGFMYDDNQELDYLADDTMEQLESDLDLALESEECYYSELDDSILEAMREDYEDHEDYGTFLV